VAFDPFLYVALLAGILAGRASKVRSPWVARATLATVVVLVGLLGAALSGISSGALLATIPVAIGFVLLILGTTTVFYLVLARRTPSAREGPSARAPTTAFPISLALLGALLVGFGIGRIVTVPTAPAITGALYVLLALVGFDLTLRWEGLKGLWVPLTAAVGAALVSALVFALAARASLAVSLATSLAFGWYTLAGPLVAARAGAVLGLLAFLTNFLRENLTMLLSPYLGRRLRGAGLAALGGATSMDTTLYFVTRFGEKEAASLSLATGLLLTLAASLILPAVLALPF
jgi:uncharacterized membrane protein YbjE (DUF340 family)